MKINGSCDTILKYIYENIYGEIVKMATFRFSAFADECSADFDAQITALEENNIKMIELRGVDGESIADISEEKCRELKKKLDLHGIEVSAIGSPIGKIGINDDFVAHMGLLRRMCEYAEILETDRIRVFSFYIPEGEDASNYRDRVIEQMNKMLDIADEYGVKLCHENEKGIYGDTPERTLDLLNVCGDRLGCVFDPCNFIQCGSEAFPSAFLMLKDRITYVHIKDCKNNGTIIEPGYGNGGIPEILAVLNRERDDEIVLTMEPHLNEFVGLSALEEGAKSAVVNKYDSAELAFAAAIAAARICLPRNASVR